MNYFVYMLKSLGKEPVTYVGYTKNLSGRLKLHNCGKGAKYTKGRSWKIIYSKKFTSKSEAIKNEYKLKKNHLLRKKIKNKAL